MATLIDTFIAPLTENDALPDWLRYALPYAAHALSVLAVIFAAWFLSWLLKVLVRGIGRRRMKAEEAFDGSAWDLGGSLVQFFVLVCSVPAILTVLGFDVMPFLESNAGSILTAFAILAVGITVSRWLAVSIRGFGERAKRGRGADDTLFTFIASMLRYTVLALAAVFALQQVGFAPGSLIAVVGAIGLAIALALQDTLRAVAAGVMLALFRPFRNGDWVLIAGSEGEVIDVTPFHTTVKTIENRAVIIPNDKAWADPIINFNRLSERRLDLYFEISYEDDIDHAMEVMCKAIADLPGCRRASELWAGVHELTAYAVMLRVRPWIARNDVLNMRSACIRAVKLAFDREGITIPYPQQVEFARKYSEIAPQKPEPSDQDAS